MQTDSELSSTHNLLLISHEEEEKEFAEIAAKMSEDFDFKLTFLGLSSDHEGEEVEEERDHNEAQVSDDAGDDFSFVINGSDPTLVSDASIRPYFPLFNRDLLLVHEDYKSSSDHKSVPSKPEVEKIFMETTSSSKKGEKNSETDTVNGIATGPYCAWEKTSPELSKKSNSTGFSKLWRFKEYLSRSHSDGNDAFVFLNKPVHKKPAEKKVVKKSKVLSAHEVYLRSKGIYPEHDKRRSYLPYKPEVVGFFTSVNGGGLSKNVHPY